MSVNSKFVLPFGVKFDSSVSGGYAQQLHDEYKEGTEIVNYHTDDVQLEKSVGSGIEGQILDAEIQSPFTERWVGGRSYRHVNLNTGNDTAQTRPEGWHVGFQPNVIRLYSHAFLDSPPAYWTREGRAKKPVNIKNIQNDGTYVGNYAENYEFLQTSGRRITNNLIVDGFIASGSLTTQFVSGTNNYSLPNLLIGESGSRSVIVDRFNAPGSKEESPRGALDREGEEMSPNIPLPFRNIKIRQPYYRQLAQHSPQFGSGSTYKLLPDTGTEDSVAIHKINRNRLVRAGVEYFDNGFVVNAIPRTDIQYSWITASAETTAAQLGGYQSYRLYNSTGSTYDRNQAYSDITFISGSLVKSGSNEQYFVDNIFLNSLVKEQKTINTETNTFSINSSLSASLSEHTNSPYTFTSWTSMRLGETPVARALRKQNQISVLDTPSISEKKVGKTEFPPRRGSTTTNYKEPPVTFKYLPIEHDVRFSENGELFRIEHEYANTLSVFANKDLTKDLFLREREDNNRFYDYLFIKYADENYRDMFYEGHKYSEIVWPREENTGLSRTRKREAYYLDRSGFDRDGYDRQLGTQRAFWRDNQSDRKRSNLSDGGYYNSLGYLSTQETGSNFTQAQKDFLSNNSYAKSVAQFEQLSGIDKGFYNSISILEKQDSERELFAYTASVNKEYASNGTYYQQQLFDINKRGYVYDTNGEFGSLFIDFVQNETVESEKKSLGSLYRNTLYKQVLTAIPEDREAYERFLVKQEDEELTNNPKIKYLSFLGGVETNNSSFVQNTANYNTSSIGTHESFSGKVYDMAVSGSDLYVVGSFVTVNSKTVNRIAKFDGTSWSSVGDGFNSHVYVIEISGSDIYVGGNFTSASNDTISVNKIAKWNGASWESVGSGFSSAVQAITFSGSDVYAGGSFTGKVSKYDGSWNTLGFGLDNTVYSLLFSGSDLYAGGSFTSTGSAIARWDGADWNAVGSGFTESGTYNVQCNALHLFDGEIYAGGRFDNVGPSVAKWNGASWESVGTGLPNINNSDFQYVNDLGSFQNELYAVGYFITSSINHVAKWDGNSWSGFEDPVGIQLLQAESLLFKDEKFYVSSYFFPVYYSEELEEWKRLYSGASVFSNNYYQQQFQNEDFIFTTMDNGIQRKIEEYSNKKPFFDSYEHFIQDVKGKVKDYSIIPEFKISDHMEYYVEDNSSNFATVNRAFLSLDGASETNYQSANDREEGYSDVFFETYSTSDLLKKYEKIQQDNDNNSELESITLNVKGIKKLLPYNGFYPQDRTAQIAGLYNNYVDNNLGGGVYNLSYKSDFYNSMIVTASADIGTTSSNIRSISVEKYNSGLYMAVGASYEDNDGKIFIYSSSAGDPTVWEQGLIKEISGSVSGGSQGAIEFGQKVKLFSGSNGLNLITVANTTGSLTTRVGYLLHCSSSNGIEWSEPSPLQIHGTSEYVSGSSSASDFGQYFDLHYEQDSQKIVISIGAFKEDNIGTDSGEVSIVTGSIVGNDIQWSAKNVIYTGSAAYNYAGVGVSLLSCSNGYQTVFSEFLGDSPTFNIGNLLISTSSNGEIWSTPKIIAQGEEQYSSIGQGNLKIVDFNNKSYIFFGEPSADIGGTVTDNGGIFVISSSTNNQWPTTDTYLDKKLLYYREVTNDKNPTGTSPTSFWPQYLVESFSGSDGRLYYCFCNTSPGSTELAFGWSDNQENFQTIDNGGLLIDNSTVSNYESLAVTDYNLSGLELPIFIYADTSDDVYAFKNNLFTNFSIRVEGQENKWKLAALEPFFAPGILYNTIKSGLSVDWPCATGSIASIEPYGGNSLVNTYYPKSIEMYRNSDGNNLLTSYGLLRSNIDYRMPFESVIFPERGFAVEKDEITSDLTSTTILSSLSEDDPIIENLANSYIYGGYEPFISYLDFNDFDKIGPKSFSVPFVYRKKGSIDNGLYSMAMSNFLAETVQFFLKGKNMNSKGEMIAFTSKEDSQWPKLDTSKTYYMDIVMKKSSGLVMMEAYHSDLHPTGTNGEKMNGRYFGYPVNKTNKDIWGEEEFTEAERRTIHNDPAYAPYTPPYFEGAARLRLSYKPTSEDFTFDDLEKGIVIEEIYDGLKDAHESSDAYLNKMSIESSINLFGKQFGTRIDSDGLEVQDTGIKYWVISPKMETPVLDFSDQTLESYQNDYSKTSGFGRGMWSGYGISPKGRKGIEIKIENPFPELTTAKSSLTGSLVDLLFEESTRTKKIGQIASKRKISEGLVVIPYLEKKTEQTVTLNNGTDESENSKFNFIKVDDGIYEEVENAMKSGDIKPKDNSIAKMIEGMRKYILPPPLDFVRNDNVPKIAMYIIDIEHTLKRQDLEDIWQGVMPEISRTAEELGKGEGINLTHKSDRLELFHGEQLDPELRWMVFKVKQKGEKDYFKVTKDSSDDENFRKRDRKVGRQLEDYSYNWPYDYFSLLEFAKIELRLKHKKK